VEDQKQNHYLPWQQEVASSLSRSWLVWELVSGDSAQQVLSNPVTKLTAYCDSSWWFLKAKSLAAISFHHKVESIKSPNFKQ